MHECNRGGSKEGLREGKGRWRRACWAPREGKSTGCAHQVQGRRLFTCRLSAPPWEEHTWSEVWVYIVYMSVHETLDTRVFCWCGPGVCAPAAPGIHSVCDDVNFYAKMFCWGKKYWVFVAVSSGRNIQFMVIFWHKNDLSRKSLDCCYASRNVSLVCVWILIPGVL